MPTDLIKLDPATVKASVEFDALIAELWMVWRQHFGLWFDADGPTGYGYTEAAMVKWSPSTNFAHAVEAMLKAEHWRSETFYGGLQGNLRLGIRIELDVDGEWYYGQAYVNETNGDKALAMALAICLAILAALKAAAEAKEEK